MERGPKRLGIFSQCKPSASSVCQSLKRRWEFYGDIHTTMHCSSNEALQTCSSKLTETGGYIATLEEAIRLFNEAIISYPSYRQIAQNKS